MPAYENGNRPPVRQIYKYLKPEHVEGAVTEGRFRIGTLLEYRDGVKYPGAQLDRGEGDMRVDGIIHGFRSEAGHKPSPMMTKIFGPGLASGNAKIDRCIVENFHDRTPNLYIFCSACRFNMDVFNRPEYGAAVLISDEYAFCMALTRKLIALGLVPNVQPPVASGEIQYRERLTRFMHFAGKNEIDVTVPWFFIKPNLPNYMEEFERRFVWPIQSLREDRIIDFPEAAQYVSVYQPETTPPGRRELDHPVAE